MIPQLIRPWETGALPPDESFCDWFVSFCQKWKLEPLLALKLCWMAARVPFELEIISGYRTPRQQQDELEKPDSTAAPVALSNHTACPARAADLNPRVAATDLVKLEIGRAAFEQGLRWGGGADRDEKGIPLGREWRHVDLGPRSQSWAQIRQQDFRPGSPYLTRP